MPHTHFSDAIIAFGTGDYPTAAASAHRAAQAQPSSRVYAAAATYLARVVAQGQASVYNTGDAFALFIRNGGNVPLYANTSTTLRQIYARYTHVTLLDIGVGDGMALLPALTPQIVRLDIVEPSSPMLAQTCATLDARGIAYSAFNGPIQVFCQHGGHWDLAQATFSLQSLDPNTRHATLAWLRQHAIRVLIAEFDVPNFDDLYAPERIAHITARYELGLAEYQDDDNLVAQGFLMPVFFGYFDPTVARVNYEQPISAWEADLRSAGFSRIARRKIYPYWWAPAYLLDAM